jgi:hypothetical protein
VTEYLVEGRPVKVGDEVVLGEHDNHPSWGKGWHPDMEGFVGSTAVIMELWLSYGDKGHKGRARVDTNGFGWRLENMTWPKPQVQPTPPTDLKPGDWAIVVGSKSCRDSLLNAVFRVDRLKRTHAGLWDVITLDLRWRAPHRSNSRAMCIDDVEPFSLPTAPKYMPGDRVTLNDGSIPEIDCLYWKGGWHYELDCLSYGKTISEEELLRRIGKEKEEGKEEEPMKYLVEGKPVKVGDEIVLGRETDHHSEVPWESVRDKYVGRTTKIRAFGSGNVTGKPVAKVDIDKGRSWWRLEDMTWPKEKPTTATGKDKKEGTMSDRIASVKGALAEYVDDGKKGFKVGASRRAARILVAQTKAFAGDQWPAFFSTKLGQELEEPAVVMALGLLAAMSEGTVPYAEQVNAATHLAIQGISAEKTDKYLGFASALLPFVGKALPADTTAK